MRKLFTCGSYVCQTLFMSLNALLLTSGNPGGSSITCISLSLGCGGFAWAGFSINHLDIAPQYAAILMGISNTIGTIPGIISPAITGILVKDGVSVHRSMSLLLRPQQVWRSVACLVPIDPKPQMNAIKMHLLSVFPLFLLARLIYNVQWNPSIQSTCRSPEFLLKKIPRLHRPLWFGPRWTV